MSRRSARRKRRAASKQGSAKTREIGRNHKPEAPQARSVEAKSPQEAPVAASDPATEIRTLLSNGKLRQAVDAAKAHHKNLGSAESESLLVEAYRARIQSMVERGMLTEAKALVDLVRDRYPSGHFLSDEYGVSLSIQTGNLNDALAPLANPELPAERRSAIETALKQNLTDLKALADCTALSPQHPLRRGAQALWQAFDAVTSGPVREGDLDLSEVSRRSPLAPWKALIRAIASFHRNDDEGCQKWLETIDPESAPARLVSPMRDMMNGKAVGPKVTPSSELARLVGGGVAELQRDLQALDKAFDQEGIQKIFKKIEKAVQTCKDYRPGILEKLKQHIAVRHLINRLPMKRLTSALGGPVVQDANFWLLVARFFEDHESPPFACSLWENFRKEAIQQGWFEPKGVEVATLYLHMARLLGSLDPEELEWEREEFWEDLQEDDSPFSNHVSSLLSNIRKSNIRSQDLYFLYPEILYEQACEADPTPENFGLWRDSLGKDWKKADEVFFRWHEALPDDPQPLLYLTESAEKRNALNKALKYLSEAEMLDGLNPKVRRARVHLLVAIAIRHLKQRKPHLFAKDFEEIEALPQIQEGDRLAFSSALRWVCAVALEEGKDADLWKEETTKRLKGNSPCTTALLVGLVGALGLEKLRLPISKKVGDFQKGQLAEAVSRASALGQEMGVRMVFPTEWNNRLFADLKKKDCAVGPDHLRALAETALEGGNMDVGYVASGAGLRCGGAMTARFLFLRSQSLREWDLFERRDECLQAAAALARGSRQMDLLDEIMEAKHKRGSFFSFLPWLDIEDEYDFSLSSKEINRIVKRESKDIALATRENRFHSQESVSSLFEESFNRFLNDRERDDYQDRGKGNKKTAGTREDELDDIFMQSSLFDLDDEDEDDFLDDDELF